MVEVSVIITSYNVAGYIAQAAASALEQAGPTLEVIVVDDASSDNSWNILSGLNDPRLRLHRLARNAGPGAARNAGIAMAQGAWIAVLDGDDQYLPGRLQHCLARAEAEQADIVIDNLLVYREVDGTTFPMFAPEPFARLHPLTLPVFIRERVAGSRYTLGYTKPLFRRAFLQQHALVYDTDLRIGEDYRLLAEALALGARVAITPTTGYRYTVRKGSISHRLSRENLSQMMAADAAFAARHRLAPDAAQAQRRRQWLQREYDSYLQLVEAIKARNLSAMLAAIVAQPTALRHLWQPLRKRLLRAE